jgi:GntR family transcriptional regulator, transcriptional repressor for pyruvate dehydrogenase complex
MGGTAVKGNLVQTEDDRLWAVLALLARHSDPLGSTTLCEQLNADGWSLSEATVGRILRRLEHTGALEKRGRQGRVLTLHGRALLGDMTRARRQRSQGMELSELLIDSGYRRIREVMLFRLLVEGEAAAQAAENGTSEQFEALEAAVARSHNHLADGGYNTDDDSLFHNTIADASGNGVLAAMVRFLREPEGMARLFMDVRKKMGLKSMEDHVRICDAIRARRPELARASMRAHLQNVLDDLHRFVADQRAGSEESTQQEQG